MGIYFMGSHRSNFSSGINLRIWSDCVDVQTDFNLHCTNMPICTLCVTPAHDIVFTISKMPFSLLELTDLAQPYDKEETNTITAIV